nr:phosphatase PAP2 family protein [uncultured Rhodopila sp.]
MAAQTIIWLLIGLIGIADIIALFAQGLSVDFELEWQAIALIAILLAASRLCRLRSPQAARFTTALAQIFAFGNAGTVFTYVLTAASPFPLADPWFEQADIALGFHWLAWFNWVNHHPAVQIILGLAYNSMAPQAVVLVMILSYINVKRVDEFLTAGILAIIITFPIMYLLPSIGAFAPHGIDAGVQWQADILTLRSHSTSTIRPLAGIVTFPSYHTALGVLYINMARERKWLFYPLLPLNVLLAISVMSQGGHYLVDMLSGAVLALVSLAIARLLLSADRRAMLPRRESRKCRTRATLPDPVGQDAG